MRVSFLLTITLITGCSSGLRPKLAPPGSWETDYIIGGSYRLRQPLFLVDDDDTRIAFRLSRLLVKESTRKMAEWRNVPRSVKQYEDEGSKKWPAVMAVLPPGTVIQYKGLSVQGSPDSGPYALLYAVILDEKLVKVGWIDITRISITEYTSPPDKPIRGPATAVDSDCLEYMRGTGDLTAWPKWTYRPEDYKK